MRAVEPDRRKHAVEQLPGTADEGEPLDVFVAAGRLADEHHARLRIAVREYELRCGRAQRTALKLVERGAQLFECGDLLDDVAGGEGGRIR